MKNRFFYFITVFALLTLQATADATEILVFRSSGVIDVFKTDDIKSIELSKFDKDSIEQPDYCSQVFKSTTKGDVIIPINEIDSVSFGARNSIIPKNGWRRLTEAEANAITLFTHEKLRYSSATPENLILKRGERVYYDNSTDVMPYGLCAVAGQRHDYDNYIEVDIEYVSPNDAFDQFIVTASDFTNANQNQAPQQNRPHIAKFEIKRDYDNFSFDGKFQTSLDFFIDEDDGIIDLTRGYARGTFNLGLKVTNELKFYTPRNLVEHKIETEKPYTIPLKFFGGVLSANLEINIFADLLLEALFEYDIEATNGLAVEWEYIDGRMTIRDIKIKNFVMNGHEARTSVHLKGEAFFGPKLDLRLGLLFDRAGGGVEIKAGPCLTGEIGTEALVKANYGYDSSIFNKAYIKAELREKSQTYLFFRDKIIVGLIEKVDLPFSTDIRLEAGRWNLFPQCTSRASLGRQTSFLPSDSHTEAVSTATVSKTAIEYSVDMGFALCDAASGEVLAVTDDFQKMESSTDIPQVFDDEIPITDNLAGRDMETMRMHPVFNYGEYRIIGKPAKIANGISISPIISRLSTTQGSIVAGMSAVNNLVKDSTEYIIGNIVPIISKDPIKEAKKRRIASFVDLSDKERLTDLIGTWRGEIAGDAVSLTFNPDLTGSCNGNKFTYTTNIPLNGSLVLNHENGLCSHLFVTELNASEMHVTPQKVTKISVLHKIQ